MAVSGFFVRDLRSWCLVQMGGLVLSNIILPLLQLVLIFIRKDSQYVLQVFWITFSWLTSCSNQGWDDPFPSQSSVWYEEGAFFVVTLVLVLLVHPR